jgi:uncharacterized protein
MIIGRNVAKEQLTKVLETKKAEMVALYGRRRVGKTYLIKQFYKDRIAFEISGLPKANKAAQLMNFSMSMQLSKLSINAVTYNTWMDAIMDLIKAIEAKNYSQKMVLFFDEMPWLNAKRSDFLDAFGFLWNRWAQNKNVVIVICGSATSWMIKNILKSKGSLHNRVTTHIHLHPFTLNETEELLKMKGINYPRYSILQLYMALGGIPLYLDMIEKNKMPYENINEITFKNGFLKNEFENLYDGIFENHILYMNVIREIAKHKDGLTREEILAKTKIANGGTFTEILENLVSTEFLLKVKSYNKNVKSSVYKVIDFYSLFYLKFIEPNLNNPTANINDITKSQAYNVWAGYAFENICFYHLPQIKSALGITGVTTNVSNYRAIKNDEAQGVEIDLLMTRDDKCCHIIECKHYNDKIIMKKNDMDKIKTKGTLFRHHSGYKFHIFYTLISPFGFTENQYSKELIDQELKLEHLFA